MVPDAEAVVGPWRQRLDPSAALSMPAHITLLYPFVPAGSINDDLVTRVSEVVGGWRAFPFSLSSVGWFGQDVVYLEPAPAERFIRLTRSLMESFPECRPYDGAFEDIVPHLTIGDGRPVEQLREACRGVRSALPILATVHEVCLMGRSRSPRRWVVQERLALGNQ
jgi:2'-5' RNA ligase